MQSRMIIGNMNLKFHIIMRFNWFVYGLGKAVWYNLYLYYVNLTDHELAFTSSYSSQHRFPLELSSRTKMSMMTWYQSCSSSSPTFPKLATVVWMVNFSLVTS